LHANATDTPPFLKALAEVRKIAVHEGWCYHHVQAIIVSIDNTRKRPRATVSISGISATVLADRGTAIFPKTCRDGERFNNATFANGKASVAVQVQSERL
jgi:hypothetical protein